MTKEYSKNAVTSFLSLFEVKEDCFLFACFLLDMDTMLGCLLVVGDVVVVTSLTYAYRYPRLLIPVVALCWIRARGVLECMKRFDVEMV